MELNAIRDPIYGAPATQLHITDNFTLVDNQQRHGGQHLHVLFMFAIQGGVGQIFQQRVRFPIEHAVALQDDGVSDGLGKMAFPAPRGPHEKPILAPADEAGGRQIEAMLHGIAHGIFS